MTITDTEFDEIHHDPTVAVSKYGSIVITGPYVEYPNQTGHHCPCGDIHEPGPNMYTGIDAAVVAFGVIDAIYLAQEILRLAVPLLKSSRQQPINALPSFDVEVAD